MTDASATMTNNAPNQPRPDSRAKFSHACDQITKSLDAASGSAAGISKHANTLRLFVSLLFLIGGVAGVFIVIATLPSMAADLAKEQESLKKSGIQSELREVMRQLGESELKRQSSILQDIDRSFGSLSESVAKISAVKTSFETAGNTVTQSDNEWKDLKSQVAAMKANIDKATDWLKVTATPDAQAPATTPATPPPQGQAAADILVRVEKTLMEKTAGTQQINSLVSECRKRIDSILNLMSALKQAPLHDDYPYWIYTGKLSETSRSIIKSFFQYDGKVLNSSAAVNYDEVANDLRKITEQLPSEAFVLVQDEASREAITNLASNYAATQRASAEVGAFLERVQGSMDSAKNALTAIRDSQAYKSIMDDKSGIIATVAAASLTIQGNLAAKEEAVALVGRARNAVESLDSIIALQRDLAFGAASPAFILILALCGMFAVFGATSLMRWLKAIEQDRMEKAWRQRAQTYVSVVTHLSSVGIDAVEVVKELQRIRFHEERERPVVGTPVFATLSEIASAMKTK